MIDALVVRRDGGDGPPSILGSAGDQRMVGSLFLHRASGIVYGAQVMSTELSSYHLDTDTGALTHINSVDTGLATPALAITDLNGRFLISSYYTGGGVTIHRIADDGSVRARLHDGVTPG